MAPFWKRLILATALLVATPSISQIDTIFWFAAPEISASAGDNPIYLRFMTYADPSNIVVSQPANLAFMPITLSIPANSIDSVNLTAFLAQIESPAGNAVSNNGLKITATEKITAFYELKSPTSRELFSLKGNKSMGTNFYTPFQKFWNNSVTTPASFSSIDIVATEDNTTVLITPRTAIIGHAQDVSFTVVLNEGQTYSARDMNVSASSSLAGSIVSSNKPVAVTLFSGSLSNMGCTSAMGDQITPENYTGRNFIVQTNTSNNDRLYVLGTQNGTSITVTNSGTTSTLINWGETFELSITDAINYISTNKPVYVWHTSGYGCELSATQVPNLLCAGTYNTAFTRTSGDSLGVMLYTRTGYEGMFALNGNASLIPAGAFTTVPGTSGQYKSALIYFNTANVPVNSYNEVTNSGDIFGLGVIAGNDAIGSAYTFLSEFSSYPFIEAGPNATVCANTSLPISGVIGGGDVTGLWSTSGFGNFAAPTNNLINTYVPSALDTLISPINLILTSTGSCPVQKDTIVLTVDPAPIVSASADQSLCENNAVVTLAGTVSGGAVTGNWTTLGTGDFSPNSTTLNASYIPSPTDISNGSVTLVLVSTNVGSCVPESDTMQISFTPAATVDAGPNDTIYLCTNNAIVSLSGSVSGVTTTGKWISSGSGVFSPDNLNMNATYQPSFNDLNAGGIWIYLESTSNGTCIPVQDSLFVSFTPSPFVNAGTDIISCSNSALVDLNGIVSGGTTTGIWTGYLGSFSTSDTDLTTTYTPAAGEISNGNLFLTLTSTNNGGCLAVSDVVQIIFVAPPTANFSSSDNCLYNSSSFTDFSLPGYGTLNSWAWDFGDLGTSANQNVVHQYTSPGVYTVELIVGSSVGCSDTNTVQIEIFEIPVAGFSYTTSCPNNQITVNFTDESTTVSDVINYWFYDFGGQGNSAQANPSHVFAPNGNYTILHVVRTENGCSDTITQILSIPAFPVADFSYNSNNGLNIGAVFNFINNSQNSTDYLWDFGNNGSSTVQDPSSTYFSNGNYLVTLYATGPLGCTDSTTQLITINTVTTEINTLIPNAISPNGDGKNDVWKLEFLDLLYPDVRVEIYNEWGQILFESEGYDIPWDGRYHDELVPDGTYYYVIDLTGTGDENSIYKGALLVLTSKN